MIRPLLLLPLAWLLCASASAHAQECQSPPADDPIDFGAPEPLEVVSGEERHAFSVEIADTPEETSRGLMYRPEIAPDFGMLFLFPEPSIRSFYMRNTCASLDILYLREDGEIASIVRHAVPFSERSLPSPGPVRGVLELRAGRTEELGIAPGDRVVHPRLQ
jgi:uncharacterized membrane protein (UPF0127 family)